MPLYSYKCRCGYEFDARKSIEERSHARCPGCGNLADKKLTAPNFTFGWRLDARSLNNDSDYSPSTIEKNI